MTIRQSTFRLLATKEQPSRRRFLRWASRQALTSAVVVGSSKRAAAAAVNAVGSFYSTLDVTASPFNADPTGGQDCTQAFQEALNVISLQKGRGAIYIPAGEYRLNGPLVATNVSLTIRGEGPSNSILAIYHTQTALTVTCGDMSQTVLITGIGLAPVQPGTALAGVAIQIVHPNQGSGWPGTIIRDVNIGMANPGYTCFRVGLWLTNTWRSHVEAVNWHSNIGSPDGTHFALLDQRCIDNVFQNCTIDGVGDAFYLDDYCEGLHLDNCVVDGKTGLVNGPGPYLGNGSTSPYVNLNGLYITGCEFETTIGGLQLFYVSDGWITNSHFGNATAGSSAVITIGCDLVQFSNCTMTGQFNQASPAWFGGITVQSGTGGWAANANSINNCTFTNLSCGIYLGPSVYNTTAAATKMMGVSNAEILTGPILVGSVTLTPYTDNSGNTTNHIGLATDPSALASRARLARGGG